MLKNILEDPHSPPDIVFCVKVLAANYYHYHYWLVYVPAYWFCSPAASSHAPSYIWAAAQSKCHQEHNSNWVAQSQFLSEDIWLSLVFLGISLIATLLQCTIGDCWSYVLLEIWSQETCWHFPDCKIFLDNALQASADRKAFRVISIIKNTATIIRCDNCRKLNMRT